MYTGGSCGMNLNRSNSMINSIKRQQPSNKNMVTVCKCESIPISSIKNKLSKRMSSPRSMSSPINISSLRSMSSPRSMSSKKRKNSSKTISWPNSDSPKKRKSGKKSSRTRYNNDISKMFLNQLKSESKRKKSKNKELESIFERELISSKKGKRKSSKGKKGKRKSSKAKKGKRKSSKGKRGLSSRKLRGGVLKWLNINDDLMEVEVEVEEVKSHCKTCNKEQTFNKISEDEYYCTKCKGEEHICNAIGVSQDVGPPCDLCGKTY